jgi:hypothetical protein
MPRSITTLHSHRAAQLKTLAQVRQTIPVPDDRAMIDDLYAREPSSLTDKDMEHIGVLAGRYLQS